MDIKKPLLITACSLGSAVTALGAPQTQPNNASADASASMKIQISEKAIQSGKIIIKDGQVYVRVGKETAMGSSEDKAVEIVRLDSCPGGVSTGPYGSCGRAM